MVSLQTCSTAGFWANVEGVNLYFDPGPSAIYKIREANLIPDDLKAILITHKHIDHTTDINALIESIHYQMTRKGWDYKDFQVFASADLIKEGYITAMHQKMPGKIVKLASQKTYQIEHLKVYTTKKLIEKPYYKDKLDEFGFKIEGRKYGFTYIPETFYRKGLFLKVKSDIVVLNFMKPKSKYYKETLKIIKELSPQLILLRHWVRGSLAYGPKRIAKELEKDCHIKIIALADKDVFDLKTQRLEGK